MLCCTVVASVLTCPPYVCVSQYREAYKMFGNPVDGITMHEFRRHMIRMGVPIAESDLTRLFDYLDDDNNGAIDFQVRIRCVCVCVLCVSCVCCM